jgi:serine/threonine protein kinase
MDSRSLLGMKLGSYTVQQLLGTGRSGMVFLAQHGHTHERVAIRIIVPAYIPTPQQLAAFLDRFRQHIEPVTSLRHPSLVPILEIGEQDGFAYLVMPYLRPGQTLGEYIQQNGALSLPITQAYLNQLVEALTTLHNKDIIHLHLTPSNIWFVSDQVQLADAGLASLLEAVGEISPGPAKEWGRQVFEAPEQLLGDPVTRQTDLFGLGVVLFLMLTGTPPYTAHTKEQLIHLHLSKALPSVRSARSNLPPGIATVVQRAMAVAASERFKDARDLNEAFARAVRESQDQQRQPASSKKEGQELGQKMSRRTTKALAFPEECGLVLDAEDEPETSTGGTVTQSAPWSLPIEQGLAAAPRHRDDVPSQALPVSDGRLPAAVAATYSPRYCAPQQQIRVQAATAPPLRNSDEGGQPFTAQSTQAEKQVRARAYERKKSSRAGMPSLGMHVFRTLALLRGKSAIRWKLPIQHLVLRPFLVLLILCSIAFAALLVSRTQTIQDTPAPKVLFADSLQEAYNLWPIAPSSTYMFRDDAYHITAHGTTPAMAVLPTTAWSTPIVYTLSIQQVARAKDSSPGAFGLLFRCHTQDESGSMHACYSFEVSDRPGGGYSFMRYDSSSYDVRHEEPSRAWKSLWHRMFGPEFRPELGAVNTLTVMAQGQRFTFLVNGTAVGTISDTAFQGGAIGMIVQGDGAEIACSHLLITSPPNAAQKNRALLPPNNSQEMLFLAKEERV